MTTATATGYLSIDQAAAELEISPIALHRIIARGRLDAVRLGTDGPWRIAGTELARYIAAGAPDRIGPKLSGNWFDDDTTGRAMDFERSLIAAASRQVPEPPPKVEELELSMTPGMRAAMNAQPRRYLGSPKKAPSRYSSEFVLFGVNTLRKVLWQMLNKASGKPLEKLYASPVDYDQYTALALQEMLGRSIRFRHIGKLPAQQVACRIPLSIMMDTANRRQILEAAL